MGDSQGLASYTIVAQAYVCYVGGTCILTARGHVPVEALVVGDLVVTASGALKPIVGLSCRDVDCRAHANPEKVWPIRVAVHAFAEAQPSRDLFLSPDHAVFVDDVLIPIKELVNGVSIVPAPREQWTYYHVELAQHDVILAEGLPCESFLDAGNIANGAAVRALHVQSAAVSWELACAPLVVHGSQLAAVRSRVAGRAVELAGERWAA